MLKPSMDGLGGVVLVLIVVALIWIRHLFKFKEKGLILFAALWLLVWFAIDVIDLWFDMNDGKMVIIIAVVTVITLLLFRVDRESLTMSLCVALLLMGAVLFTAFRFWWKDDVRMYLSMRLKNDYPNIELFYWANNPQLKTDWRGVFEDYRDNDYVIREALFLYLRNVESSAAIANNSAFRDEVFRAWATFNKSHTRPIDFSNPGGFDSDNLYLAEIADARPFMKWWTTLALEDKQQAVQLGYFLKLVNDAVESNVSNENYWNDFIDTFRECKDLSSPNVALAEVYQKSIDVVAKALEAKKAEASQ